MPIIKYFAVNKSLEVKEYISLDAAKKLNPDWIFQENYEIRINGNYKNSHYSYTMYDGLGDELKELIIGKWKLVNIICCSDNFFQTRVIGADIVDPTGRLSKLDINSSAFDGIMEALKNLVSFSKYESLENALLKKENDNLKKQIENYKNRLGL